MPLDAPIEKDREFVTCAAAGDAVPDGDVLASAEQLAQGAPSGAALRRLRDLVREYPRCERLEILALRLTDRVEGRSAALPAWRTFALRYPANHEAFLVTLRATLRSEGPVVARATLLARFPTDPSVADERLLRARGREELGDHHGASADFARATLMDPHGAVAPLHHARSLERRGRPDAACRVLLATRRRGCPASRLDHEIARLTALEARAAALPAAAVMTPRVGAGLRALAHLLEAAVALRGTPETLEPRFVLMVNGSLGPGGAERQLVNTALGLCASGRMATEIAVRSLRDRPDGGFFLPELRRAGITVREYETLPDGGDGPWRDLLPLLPPRVAHATPRLLGLMRRQSPDVVHLWQDGTILAAGLAALLSKVPRIVLSVRTAPPPDRPERNRPEYAVLYPILLGAPGVRLVANSCFAAARYAEWLRVSPDRIEVVPNGVVRPSARPAPGSVPLSVRFDAAAPPGLTVGGVLRFDANKRPLEWLEVAARVLALRPDARFILVGDGELRPAAEAHAKALGISDRVLFTGRRSDVGHWLRRFDVLLLLSRWEGLPNVLLEAQSVGVAVVTTPAGGAQETVLCGHILASAATPDLDDAARRVLELVPPPDQARRRAAALRRSLAHRFSLDRMLARTMEIYRG
ncbi:glycosyltransferase [Roseomonas sp. CCTCC AB2023176]|uniref:glycosyltransferase n=1 Tax=Roseomonas sp. CCTCC AB2023176 TaxID=3342640 RepID=UPI0035E11AD1